jgi:hypothetical protein
LAWDKSHQALIGHNLNGSQVINNYLDNVFDNVIDNSKNQAKPDFPNNHGKNPLNMFENLTFMTSQAISKTRVILAKKVNFIQTITKNTHWVIFLQFWIKITQKIFPPI